MRFGENKVNLKEFRENTDRNLIWTLQFGEVANLLEEAIETIENYEKSISQAIMKTADPANLEKFEGEYNE
jgi:hypothetical protein